MRITTVFRRLLGVSDLFVEGVDFDPAGLVVHVRPSWRSPRCSSCQKRAPGDDKKPETISQKMKLSEVQRTNERLYRAYLLKETLAKALDYLQPKRATDAFRDWLAWASRSKLKPFVKAARTIRRHFDGVIAYVKTRLTNGLVEGLNNKLRMIARRAFGFHSTDALIAMLFLNSGGIQLDPPLPEIHPLEL